MEVSVPLWGLFNLTLYYDMSDEEIDKYMFPSPLGDYLI